MRARTNHLVPALGALGALLLATLGPACGHDHHHHGEDDFAERACAGLELAAEAVTARVDREDPEVPVIVADVGPVRVAVPAGELAYVWIEVVITHADAALFSRPAGVTVALYDVDPEDLHTPVDIYSLINEGPPGECASGIDADYRLHFHEPRRYLLELDGGAATEVWLNFLSGPSDHTPHSH